MRFWKTDNMSMDSKKFKVDAHLLSSAVHFSVDSIVITTKKINKPGPEIIYVNPSFTTLTGYLPQEVIGKTPRILQGPKTDKTVIKRLRECLEKQEVFHGRAINYRKDGSEFWMEWHIEPIRDQEGELTHFLAIQRDVTDRIKSQQAIEQKNIALKEMLEQIQLEKKKIQEDVALNVEEVLLPALRKLNRKGTNLDKKYIGILEDNLMNLTSSFGMSVSEKKLRLSPREIEIANLIKGGLSSKEICDMLNISFKTIETHRNKIRRKLGIINKNINLTTYLQTV